MPVVESNINETENKTSIISFENRNIVLLTGIIISSFSVLFSLSEKKRIEPRTPKTHGKSIHSINVKPD
jgi:hypothetical protein